MLFIIKWRTSSILSKIGVVLFDLPLFKDGFVPRWVFIWLWRHLHEATGSQRQSMWRHMTSQSIYDVIINVSHIFWFLSIKLRVLSSSFIFAVYLSIHMTTQHSIQCPQGAYDMYIIYLLYTWVTCNKRDWVQPIILPIWLKYIQIFIAIVW